MPPRSTEVLGTSGLQPVLHGPGSVQAGTRDGDRALAGLISYAAEVGASHVVHHAANLPDAPASEDAAPGGDPLPGGARHPR